MIRLLAGMVAGLLSATPLAAETLARAGDLVISDGEARAAGPTARTGAGYFSVTNTGEADDRLVSAKSPAGQRVEFHTTLLRDGIASMAPIEDGLPVPAGATVVFEQGGDHVMFMGLTDSWDPEAGVPLTLVFESAGEVEIMLPVAAAPAHQEHGE